MKLRFDYCFVTDSLGRSGGLTMLWNNDVNLHIQPYTKWHISMKANWQGGREWMITSFYGHPEASKRGSSQELLKFLSSETNFPWICFGYFNEITYSIKKKGGSSRPNKQMETFSLIVMGLVIFPLLVRGLRGLTIEKAIVSLMKELTRLLLTKRVWTYYLDMCIMFFLLLNQITHLY